MNVAPLDPLYGRVRRSPCLTCKRRKHDKEDCAPLCRELTSFRIFYRMFPPAREDRPSPPPAKRYYVPDEDLCSRDEFLVGQIALQEIRHQTGWKYREIAPRLGCSPYTVGSIMRDGQYRMQAAILEKILLLRRNLHEYL